MALTEYIQYDEIRAALGVTSKELPDTVLTLRTYENVFNKEVKEISSTCLSDYRTIDAISKASRTEIQADFALAFELFVVFAVARHLTVSLPLFSPKTIGDGKAAVTRFSDSPYKPTIDAINASYEEYRAYIKSTHAVLGGGSVDAIAPIALVEVMSPASDPVTGT